MRTTKRNVLSLVVLTAVACATLGCSHNTLGSGTSALTVNFTPAPPGLGRYERGSFDIQTILGLPINPATGVIFDTDVLVFNFDNFHADLTSTAPVQYSKIALSEGNYRVTTFRITPPSLVDTDVSATPATCIDGVAVVDKSSTPGVPASFEFTDAPELAFTVHPGQTTLSIKVNVPGLIAGYESAFTCQVGCGAGGTNCLTAFSEPTFRAAVLANVSIE
jgi:hypothetical protein